MPAKKIDHVIESQQFNLDLLNEIFNAADEIQNDHTPFMLKGKILASLFYEPSTRTRFSFESAMLKLGGSVISTENAQEFSSVTKGESLEDTIRIVSAYADLIAIRHHEIGAAKIAASASSVPIINAGDGAGQHPTQALLDLYTILRNCESVDDLTICMVGDLKYGRTVRSLCYMLGRFYKPRIIFVAPKICEMNWDIKEFLDENQVPWSEVENLNDVIHQADCIYMTRVQKERFLDMQRFEEASNRYRIDSKTLDKIKKTAFVLHPLPRLNEIAKEVDSDPRMKYFEQAKNGLWVRMALIHKLLT